MNSPGGAEQPHDGRRQQPEEPQPEVSRRPALLCIFLLPDLVGLLTHEIGRLEYSEPASASPLGAIAGALW